MGDYAGPSYGKQANMEQPPTGTDRFDAVGERLIEEGERHPAGETPVEPEPSEQPQWQAPQAPTEQGPSAAIGAAFNPPSPAEATPPSAEVTAEQFNSVDASPGQSMLPPLGPEGAVSESNQAAGEQQPALNMTPGREMLPPLNAAETSLPSPLDISPDTNTMGEHQGTTEENRPADEKPPQP